MVANMKSEENFSLQEDNESKVPKEVYVIAQEVKIVRALAGNDPKQRQRQLKKLKKWFALRSNSSFSFSDADFMRIWKGLFYSMWMSDKPLVQEDLAEDLGRLIGSFSNICTSIRFFGAFLQTMVLEWFGIDQWRIDKFLMLIRKMVRYVFNEMKKSNWSIESINLFNSQLNSSVFSDHEAEGLTLHMADVFLEELAKVSNNVISGNLVSELIKPFVIYIAKQTDIKRMEYIQNRVFYHLLWQSQRGREHNERFEAWKEMGFPTTSIHDIEKIENETCTEKDEVTESFELDPRAGNVDVFIPELPVDVLPVIELIEDIIFKDITNTKSRKILRMILQKYKHFESGGFPLGVKKIANPKLPPLKPLIEEKVHELETLEDELYSTTRLLKKLNKKKRKKFLASIDFEKISEENFDAVLKNALSTTNDSSDIWIEKQIRTPVKTKSKKRKCDVFGTKKPAKKLKSSKEESAQWAESIPDGELNCNLEKTNQNLEDPKIQSKRKSLWDEPLEDGEIEYFVSSRKHQLKNIAKALCTKTPNEDLLSIPTIKKIKEKQDQKDLYKKSTIKQRVIIKDKSLQFPKRKKVKIVLHKNMSQKPSEYIQQVRSSPQLPYDSQKMPSKGLLKPNLLPSPINPFYKQKIGLKLKNNN